MQISVDIYVSDVRIVEIRVYEKTIEISYRKDLILLHRNVLIVEGGGFDCMDNGIQLVYEIEGRPGVPTMRFTSRRTNRNISLMMEGRIIKGLQRKRVRSPGKERIEVYRSSRCRCITPTVYNVMTIGNGNWSRRINI